MEKDTNRPDESELPPPAPPTTTPPPPPISTRFKRKVNLEAILKRKLKLEFAIEENAAKEAENRAVEEPAFYKYMGRSALETVPSLCEDAEDSQDVQGYTPVTLPRVISDFLENDPHAKQALKCPICSNWMQPPIFSCPSGHSACANCQLLLTMCPKAKCMGPFSTRHFALEKVWNSMRVSCQECGCQVSVNEWMKHEEICKDSWSDL